MKLKTCKTCHHAKIKCTTTQNSNRCDRCWRLDKPCSFPLRQRRHGGPQTRNVRDRAAEGIEAGPASLTLIKSPERNISASHDPFEKELLSTAHGNELLSVYRSKMMPRFPFVVVSEHDDVDALHSAKPALCLAILAAASSNNIPLQRKLGLLFVDLISDRLRSGQFTTLDILQALLVHIAWAQYQPRPRRYTQFLSLAVSIVSDMRLDRSKRTTFWEVNKDPTQELDDWGADEVRALAGTYYLSSNSSVLMQKCLSFPYSPYILDACETLAARQLASTDKLLPLILEVQRIMEQVNQLSTQQTTAVSFHPHATVDQLERELTQLKSSITFPLNESRTLLLQIQITALLLHQSSTGASIFGLDRLHTYPTTEGPVRPSAFVAWLSESILATHSILDIFRSLPSGEEAFTPNLEWIGLYCGLSLATRLDILASQPSIRHATKHIRRLSDVSLTLRQAVLRLESLVSAEGDGEGDAMYQLSLRAKKLESWYHERLAQASRQQHGEPDGSVSTMAGSDASSGMGSFQTPRNGQFVGGDVNGLGYGNAYSVSDIISALGTDVSFSDFLFAAPHGFEG